MDKVQKHNSFNTNTLLSESYRNYQIDMFSLRLLPQDSYVFFSGGVYM
jgi:hypothetical protein